MHKIIEDIALYTRIVLCLLFLLLSFIPSAFSQTEPAMLHDLQGLIDSSNTTHLFYRLYEVEWEKHWVDKYEDDVIHYNTQTKLESVFLDDYLNENIYGSGENFEVTDYEFIANIPNNYLVSYMYTQFESFVGLKHKEEGTDYFASQHQRMFGNFQLIQNPQNPNIIYLSSVGADTTKQVTNTRKQIIPDSLNADSLSWNYSLLSMHPHQPDLRFGYKDYRLVRQREGKNVEVVDTTKGIWGKIDFYYLQDPNTIFIRTQNEDEGFVDSTRIFRSTSAGKVDSWELTDHSSTQIAFATDTTNGRVYKSREDTLLISKNGGNSYGFLTSFANRITGIYKPNTGNDTLYVSTISDIWLVEGNEKRRSLKHVAVNLEQDPLNLPSQINLLPNYPNPFNPSTKIRFSLPQSEQVIINVYNTIGQKVETLVNRQMTAGSHAVTFNAEGLPSGVYIYRIKAGEYSKSRKMLLVK